MELRYFSALDSVNFDPSATALRRAEKSLIATSTVMQNLLRGTGIPVLSQTQVFDSKLILDSVAAFDAESQAILNLVRRNLIQMKILGEALVDQGTEAETFSLKNAFRSALLQDMKLSAWSELRTRDERLAIIRFLDGDRGVGLPQVLEERVEALLHLDRAFRESGASERAMRTTSRLDSRIAHHLDVLKEKGQYLRSWYDAVGIHINDSGGDADTRSSWIRGIAAIGETETGITTDGASSHGALGSLRRIVDLEYNLIVARSLGAGSSWEVDVTASLASAIRQLPEARSHGEESAVLFQRPVNKTLLTWSETERRLALDGPHDPFAPAVIRRRLAELERDIAGFDVDQSRSMAVVRMGKKIVESLTDKTVTLGVGAGVGFLLGGSAGSGIGIAAGTLCGAIIRGAMPLERAEAKFRELSVARRLHASRAEYVTEVRVQ